jgi:hypothetical protein
MRVNRSSDLFQIEVKTVSEFAEHFLTFSPKQTELLYIGNTDTGNSFTYYRNILIGNITIHHDALCPVHQLHKGYTMAQVCE